MLPAPVPTFELVASVTEWGRTLQRHEVPFVYPGGYRLPLFRQQGVLRAFDAHKDAERLLRSRTDLLREINLGVTAEEIAE
ncbi:MAG: hypothetical protein RL318_2851, partial [Fibrobacterota bacterium]